MSQPISAERRMLTGSELAAVERSHYPAICGLERRELVEVARNLREFRDKARDISRSRRREMRGKAEQRGARPAAETSGLMEKKQVFASALKRVNRELTRQEETERRGRQGEIARKALEMKRANRVRRHPSAGRTARHGMRTVESDAVTTSVDPRQVGSVSQQNKNFQARNDG
ncbi:hypothetical protein ACFOD4_00560 [Pseudoroseomonas globiformis]|uniref:Uncharacterized protein n=1 Tax=Teichococcus globiformis TaxID=2307229 RepID=A0ABV7FW19_9PROT